MTLASFMMMHFFIFQKLIKITSGQPDIKTSDWNEWLIRASVFLNGFFTVGYFSVSYIYIIKVTPRINESLKIGLVNMLIALLSLTVIILLALQDKFGSPEAAQSIKYYIYYYYLSILIAIVLLMLNKSQRNHEDQDDDK